MRITVLGGAGAFPERDRGCSGYLVHHDGFTLLVDPGYATHHTLLAYVAVAEVDAVLVTHGHPDHCADLHPLLRTRAMTGVPGPLPVHAPAGALDALLALDGPATLAGAYEVHDLPLPGRLPIGPFAVETVPLPHFLPNAGVRLTAGGASVAYTGDSGRWESFVPAAAGADLLIAEATHATSLPPRLAGNLSTALDAGALAARAGCRALWLTHLWPGSDHAAHLAAAATAYDGPITVAVPDLSWDAS
ncbi:MBL fold metallo-hydrolase [Paractinoplanes globisporus]|uniref:MBL fold metallo-hydrolase n=1 Tax=Paractinoplanes globisporus TaxID=113565 RepID=A0ABW6WGF1_9ACTN|nr:MBL fold metallo-hydrolase [Actinoplanes globisporus]